MTDTKRPSWLLSSWPGRAEWVRLRSRGLFGPRWLGSGTIPDTPAQEPVDEADCPADNRDTDTN